MHILSTFAPGKMAEWSIASVLKTDECNSSGGSNPSLSANKKKQRIALLFSSSETAYLNVSSALQTLSTGSGK